MALFCCCVGLVYTYLAGHVGRTGDQGAFRALARGYTHWSSGRLEEMDVNTNHPEYCHVRCTMTPSMKSIPYHIYLLLGRDGELATICSATCECAAGYVVFCCYTCTFSPITPSPNIPIDQAYSIYVCIKPITLLFIYFYRKSASCTHVSAVLHCLASLNPASFQLRPNLPPAHVVGDDDTTPVTSLPCQWKRPKK